MKTHWFTSPDPPKFGEDLVALCGQVVPKAQPVKAIWDWEGDELYMGLVKCRKCDAAAGNQERYMAVIESGEESISR